MQKQALGSKITSAFKTIAGKAKEVGQKAIVGGGKDKLTKVPYMFKRASDMDLKEFAKEAVSKKWILGRMASGLKGRAAKYAANPKASGSLLERTSKQMHRLMPMDGGGQFSRKMKSLGSAYKHNPSAVKEIRRLGGGSVGSFKSNFSKALG